MTIPNKKDHEKQLAEGVSASAHALRTELKFPTTMQRVEASGGGAPLSQEEVKDGEQHSRAPNPDEQGGWESVPA